MNKTPCVIQQQTLLTLLLLLGLGLVVLPGSHTVYACGNGGDCISGQEGPKPDDNKPDPCNSSCCSGNNEQQAAKPVNLYAGSEDLRIVDLRVEGFHPIVFTRKYDNQTRYDSPLGYGWAFLLDKRLYQYADNSIVIRNDCGVRDKYVFTGGAYQPPVGRNITLTENTDGSFLLVHADGRKEHYDVQGKLTTLDNVDGHQLVMSYDHRGRLPLTGSSPYALDPDTPSVVAYDYRLIKVEEKTNNTLTGNFVSITYNDTTGRISSIQDHTGRVVSYTHDDTTSKTNGNLLNVTGIAGITHSYLYNDTQDPHNATRIQTNNELPYINVYDANDRVYTQTHGNDVFTFNYSNLQTTVTHTIKTHAQDTNPQTSTMQVTFNEDGYAVNSIRTLSDGTRYRRVKTRDTESQIIQELIYSTPAGGTESLFSTTDYDYNGDGNKTLEKVTLPTGEMITRSWGYDENRASFEKKVKLWEQTVSSLAPDDIFRTEYTYHVYETGPGLFIHSNNIKAIKRKKANGSFQTTHYDYEQNQVKTITLPDGVKINNVYDDIHVTLPGLITNRPVETYYEGTPHLTRQFEFTNYVVPPLWIEDAKGQKTHFEYDDRYRVTQVTNRLGEETHYTYTDEVLTQIEIGRMGTQEGQVLALEYTNGQWLSAIKRKNSSPPAADVWITVASYTHDSAGNRLTSTRYRDGQALTTHYTYAGVNRIASMIDANGNTTLYGYDVLDNRTRVVEAVGTPLERETRYTYDGLSRLTKIEQDYTGIKATTTLSYDAMGNLLTVTDPENKTTTYIYDRLSRRTRVTQPNGDTVQYIYTSRDQVDYMINGRGDKIDYTYASWGGLTKVEYYDSSDLTIITRTVTYDYDINGNIIAAKDSAIQANNLYTFTYDASDRLDITTIGYLPVAVTLDNNYDRYGNRSQFALNDGVIHTHSFTYNKLNQLQTISLPGSQNFIPEYNEDTSRLKKLTYPSGVTTAYLYENHGPIKQILTKKSDGLTIIEQLDYVYDVLINVDSMNSSREGGLHDYDYDSLGHLIEAIHPNQPNENFTYDKVGNRTGADYGYNINHQITKSPGTASYTFDADGNMTAKTGGFTYGYNKDNRLVSFTDTNTTTNNATYQYDPFGRRISKMVDGVKIWFMWDATQIIAEYDSSGTQLRRYSYIPDYYTPIQIQDSNGIYDVYFDRLQSPTLVTDNTQTVVWSRVQTAFGETTTGSFEFNFIFPGQYADRESGLNYNYYRDYAPSLGRYIQSDPIGLLGGQNTYSYADANPIRFVDPFGLWSASIDGYLGIGGPGGGVTIGRDPNGNFFWSVRLGFGAGAGIGVDPNGTSPAYDPCKQPDTGSGYIGGFTQTEIGLSLNLEAQARAGFGELGGSYTNTSYTDGFSEKFRISAQIGIGVERSGYF